MLSEYFQETAAFAYIFIANKFNQGSGIVVTIQCNWLSA